jgi:two-component system phosphate regulon sensor histidine kinase PhoR
MDEHLAVRALIEALPDAALLLDMGGNIQLANAHARKFFNVPAMQGPVSFFLRAPAILDAIEAGAKGGPTKVRYRERGPFDRWIEAHIAPLPAQSGEARHTILVVLRDLTEAEQLERMRADFVANASHELRTPLASLSGFIETLQGPARDDPEARQRFLAIMQAQAARMSRLIGDLLSLSRIELDEHVRPETKVDLAAIAAQAIDSLRPLAQEDAVEIVLTASDSVPVIGARDELARLTENLVENAIKYAGSGKRIAVSVAIEQGPAKPQAVLRVRDFGPGIAPEHLPRLTERFYRVDVGESRAKGGTGLGLAIVKHIVSRHHAALAIESVLGQGATFTVRFDPAE